MFSDPGCSRRKTHSFCVGMVSHPSQVHQNVPSNRLFTSSFSISLSSALGTRSGSKRVKISHDLEYKQNLLGEMTSRLAAWPLSTCFKMAATDAFLGIACTLIRAETSVSTSTKYELFIGDDKKNTLFGVTFSFKKNVIDCFSIFLVNCASISLRLTQ